MARRLQLDRSNHTLVPQPTHRSHRRRSPRRRAIIAAVLASLTVVGVITAAVTFRHATADSAWVAASEELGESQLSLDVLAPEDFGKPFPVSALDRPVYRHSVVPGGTYSPDELRGAIARDVVVAAHYEKLDQSRLRTETVPSDRYVHVSYRKGDRVFWTAKKVLLRKGETILTDGTTQIRTRCGNCIAEEPAGPTSAEEEPDVVEFDRLVDAPAAPEPVVALVTAQPLAAGSPSSTDPISSFGPALLNDVPLGTEPLRSETGGAGAPDPLAAAERAGGPGNSNPPLLPELPPTGSDNPLPPFTPLPPSLDDPLPPGTDDLPPYTPFVPPIDNPPGNPQTPVPVPEPGTLLLLGGGAAELIRRYRRRSTKG